MRLAAAALAALALCGAAAAATGDPQYKLSPADQAWTGTIVLGA
jgi:opacity protein-like surface antigen